MNIKINNVEVKDLLSKSNLPASDYVINPYVGCMHACKYCYASFMKRFTGHNEEWGKFLDIKKCSKNIDVKRLVGKRVFMSSVTDCYNPLEGKEKLTRSVLEQIKDVDCELTITTKSTLILRDLDLIKQCKNVIVAISINTLDEKFKNDMDKASPIKDRINTIKVLHENGIKTVLFMSPIFPEITDFVDIINNTKDFVDEYWFENLNLRGDYKFAIMDYIRENRYDLFDIYAKIYYKRDDSYWGKLKTEIIRFCKTNNIKYQLYFHHENNRTKQ